MNVLILSSDIKALDRQHDSFIRMKEYSDLVDHLDVIVFGAHKRVETNDKLTVYPLSAAYKILQPFQCISLALRLSRQKKFDVIVTQDPIFYGLCGYIIARLANAKLLVSAYGTNIFNVQWKAESLNNRLRYYLGRYILKVASAIQADGFEDVAELKERFGGKVFWKPIVPSTIADFASVERSPASEQFKILFVGRLVRQKNITLLVEVMQEAIKWRGDQKISFTIVGDGPLRGYLLEQVKARDLVDYVDYRPEVSRSDMVKIYAEHQLLILTSFYEGFAKVFMEAAAAGLPIVTTKVSGVANIVRDKENSFAVEQGDLNNFVVRILELARQPELGQKFSQQLRSDFAARYHAGLTIAIQKEIFNFLGRTDLLILTQVLDINHGILGFFHRWIEEFAKSGRQVTVVCLFEGEHRLPPNVKVISLGKDKNASKFSYLIKFYKIIWQARNNYDAVFVHMNQIYVILGWKIWRLLRKPVGMWYAHGATPWDLRLAVKLTNYVFTSTPEGCRIKSGKIQIVGQGIDTDYFALDYAKKITDGCFRILTVGRISPVKDYETLIGASKLLKEKNLNFQVQIIGGPGNAEQEKYLNNLREIVKESGLVEQISFLGPLPQSRIISYLQSADVFVNMSRTGSLDKAILEAMACELPILTSNEALAGELGELRTQLMFISGDADELAGKISDLAQTGPETNQRLGSALREIVVSRHNLSGLIRRIADYLKPNN